MKTNQEIRKGVAATLRNRWFWRMLVAIILLNLLPQLVNRLLSWAFTENGIHTWQDFAESWKVAHQSGLAYTVPSMRVALEMTGSSLFMTFILYVFVAISALGLAQVALKASRNEAENWFASSFVGFKRPLGLVWFMAILNLRVCLWSLLFFFPGVIALYRYRNGWYLKCDHPEWSVSKCLSESGKMMKGKKWRAFCLDLSYCWRLVLALTVWVGVAVAGVAIGSWLWGAILSLIGLLALGVVLQLMVGITVARAEFYREQLLECSLNSSESLA